MHDSVREYMAKIGRRGGLVSRRALSSETARKMVMIREARRAYHRFYAQCFWSYDPGFKITEVDVSWVIEQLMRHGGREAWQVGVRLSRGAFHQHARLPTG